MNRIVVHLRFPVVMICLFMDMVYFTGCGASMEAFNAKADSPLLQKFEKSGDEEVITVFVQSDGIIDAGRRAEIELAGIIIRSLQGNIFTAEGKKGTLLKLAQFGYITRLELPQQSFPTR